MKYFTSIAFVAALAGMGIGMGACSSGDSAPANSSGGFGNTSAGGSAGKGGAATGGASTAGANTGGASTAGASTGGASTGGASTGGASTGGAGGASGGAGGAGGASGGAGGASGGAGGAGGSSAVVTTCGAQMYTPTATPGAACASKTAPTVPLIAAFEGAGVAAGWGVYPNVDGKTGFTPNSATPSPGGANGTAQALTFTVTAVEQGIKTQVGFGAQCQDVRAYQGLSFWAKGTIDAATLPFAVDANTLVILLGSETSAQGGCTGTCGNAPDRRVTITADWKEYRIPFNCFGNGMVFDGYYTNILFNAFGTNSKFSIDQVGYY